MEEDPKEEAIVITDGIAYPAERFFAIRTPQVKPYVYEIKKINIDAEGIITVDAFHHPVNENGFSMLGVNWTTYETDANWIIEL
jgi:hypothetical protein